MLNITKNISLLPYAAYLEDCLIIADLHLGVEQSLRSSGLYLPKSHYEDIQKRFKDAIGNLGKVSKIIINGDIKEEFGKISDSEWRYTLGFFDFLKEYAKEIVLVRGNHDTQLEPIAKKRNLNIVEYEIVGSAICLHGDEMPENFEKLLEDKKIKTVVIGHQHPAIVLGDSIRKEKYSCFLRGKWKKYELIILPAFSPLASGSDVLSEKSITPFASDFSDFDVFPIGEEVLPFGKVKEISEE